MFFNMYVPADVPSDRHNSAPVEPSKAEKYATSLRTTRPQEAQPAVAIPGLLELLLGFMSFTKFVPASVPSENQSSAPSADVVALKKKPVDVAPEGILKTAALFPGPAHTSFTMYVPADVPSVRHSSCPFIEFEPRKYPIPLNI